MHVGIDVANRSAVSVNEQLSPVASPVPTIEDETKNVLIGEPA
jgi:hypothetical protein